MEPTANTSSTGNRAGDIAMNSQPQTRPNTRTTAASLMVNAASSSSQPTASNTNQTQGFSVDLTNLDDAVDTKNFTEMINNNPYIKNDMGTPVPGGMGSMAQQDFFNAMDAVPKFDSEALNTVKREGTYDYANPNASPLFNNTPQFTKFESQAPESINTNTGQDAFQAQGFGQVGTVVPPLATPAPIGQDLRGGTEAPQEQTEHVPPNRITEAGPVTHPDRDWRPYGKNHWHVFLHSPETLKYISTAEIKEIREHCNQISKTTLEEHGDPDNEQEILPIPNTAYTTADAQTVWAHCDAYIRRRGQLRNNNAARRSRQRRDAELRYWRQKALEYGCPDHEFEWDGQELPPDPAANAYASGPLSAANAAAAAAATPPPPARPQPYTRAAARRSARVQEQRRAAAAAAGAGSVAAPEIASMPYQPAGQGNISEYNPPLA